MAPGISTDDDFTIEDLQRSKSELISEHGLEGTALGDAAKKLEDDDEQSTQRERLVRKRLLLETAEQQLGADDPDVEALRADVHDLSNELSEETAAAALVEHHEEIEARERIAELESLANSTEGASSASFAEKAEALRSKHGLEGEPGRYEAEALIDQPDETDADAEALADFRERQATREADEELPQEAQEMISRLKNMREHAKQNGSEEAVDRYTVRIKNIRAEHA